MKKKGLIISTVVMVVVLIASLTTATYAWFSAQAQATVDDLTINTKAATGLQIAMRKNTAYNLDNLVSGDLTYDNAAWAGTDGWGTYLGFGQILVGEIEHAATYFKATDKIPVFQNFKLTTDSAINAQHTYYVQTEKTGLTPSTSDVIGLFVESTTTGEFIYTTDKVAKEGTKYYSFAIVETPTQDDLSSYYVMNTSEETITADTAGYYQPTGYDSKTQPTGYRKAVANQAGSYYHLTMAVTNVMEVGALGFNVEVIPSGETQLATKQATVNNPGMAAASRIEVSVRKNNDNTTKTTTVAPFSAYKLLANKTMSAGTGGAGGTGYTIDKDGALNASGKYTHILGSGSVAANTVYYVDMIIWVEGTDNECNNSTTGTSMLFKINFAYAAANTTTPTWDWQNTAGTATEIKFE